MNLNKAKFVAWSWANELPKNCSGQITYSVVPNGNKYKVVKGEHKNALYTVKPGDPKPNQE